MFFILEICLCYRKKGYINGCETVILFNRRFFGYKCCMMGINSAEKTVFCILYDSFWLECSLNDRYGRFGAGIRIGKNGMITNFLGESCSLNSDEKSIKESLRIIVG